MGRFGRYQMLLGEPCRCYHKNTITNEYEYVGNGYYIGNGLCVIHCFTDIRDDLNKGIVPTFIQYDRYIPTRLFNTDWWFELKKNGYTNQKPINSPDFVIEDFNTDAIVDYYRGHLDEFWWWHEIQKLAKNYTNR